MANVKAGKGDPCKLVGLTVAQIQAGVIDNNTYRLPTNTENQTFFGTSTNTNDATYSTWTANQANEASPGTRTFLKSTPANAVLPAAGYRSYSSGGVNNRGTRGFYWSSTPLDGTNGYMLLFYNTNVYPSNYTNYGAGNAVRCVPQ
ncbi:MAG: fibrobacter succinogenes major paralogous domain-containing protein [Alistipes sp.]|nr:fibrobacter succinogenes major paralogous domain-containing protein [Alistipes sp.]